MLSPFIVPWNRRSGLFTLGNVSPINIRRSTSTASYFHIPFHRNKTFSRQLTSHLFCIPDVMQGFAFTALNAFLTLSLAVAVLLESLLLYMFQGSLLPLLKQISKPMHCSTTCTGPFTPTSSNSPLHSTRCRFLFN